MGDIYLDPVLNMITAPSSDFEDIDCEGLFITPGFTDIHIHGAFGFDVSDLRSEDIVLMAKKLPFNGVTSFLPTLMSLPLEKISKAASAVSEAASVLEEENGPYASILGLRLEGPFLSGKRAGVQSRDCLLTPKEGTDLIEDLVSRYPGLIKIIDIAPETEGAREFTKRLSDLGIVVSAGHTECDYNEAVSFFENGGRSVTHMFNAMKPLGKREPNLPGAAFDRSAFAELICDGLHVDKTVVRMAFRMFGDKIITISDSMRAAGLGDGKYDLGGNMVTVIGGRTFFGEDNVLAGSVTDISSEIENLISWGIGMEDAITSVTKAPNELLMRPAPSLAPGSQADICMIDKEGHLKMVICKGHILKV